jgi:hypothetical protein
VSVIPAICDTPKCGTVWFAAHILELGSGSSAQITNCATGPCPACGGSGRIPDGIYTNASAHLLKPRDAQKVLNALNALREQVKRGGTTKDIEQEITRKYPFLKNLAPFLPKNALELGTYLLVIATLVSPYVASRFEKPAQSVHAEEHHLTVLEQVSSYLKTSPPKNRARHRQKSRKQK